MDNAPERIWADDGGYWCHDLNTGIPPKGNVEKYIRADLADKMVSDAIQKAADELKLREEDCAEWFKTTGNHASVYDQLTYARATILQGVIK